MIFHELSVQNFLSISSASITFESGLHYVSGRNLDMAVDGEESNGTGKSALFGEALEWVLWGTLSRGNSKADAVVNSVTGKDCVVCVSFEDGGNQWKVQRTRKHIEHGNSLRWWVNGHERTSHEMSATKAELTEALPISHKVFRHAIQIGQGLPDKFLALPEAEKQRLLCDILNLDLYDEAHARAKSNLVLVSAERDAIVSQTQDLQGNISDWKESRSQAFFDVGSLKKALSEFEDYGDRIIETESDLNILIQEGENLQRRYHEQTEKQKAASASLLSLKEEGFEEVRVAESQKRSAETKWNEVIQQVGASIQDIDTKKASLAATLRSHQANLGEINRTSGTCSQCGQTVVEEAQIDQKRSLLQEAIREHVEAEETLSKEKLEYLSTYQSYEEQQSKALQDWAAHIDRLRVTAKEKFKEDENKLALLQTVCNTTHKEIQTNFQKASLAQETLKQLREAEIRQRDQRKFTEQSLAKAEERVSLVTKYIETAEENLRGFEKTLTGLEKKESHWKYWKDTIPNLRAATLDEVLGYLNQRIEEYLNLFSGGVMGMTVYQKQRGKGSKVEVDLRTPGGSYEMSSGGERRRVDLAVYLALSDLVHVASGLSCNVLVADEIMDGLSPEGVRKFATILREKADAGMCVFVISHNPVIQQMANFDSFLTVERREGLAQLV